MEYYELRLSHNFEWILSFVRYETLLFAAAGLIPGDRRGNPTGSRETAGVGRRRAHKVRGVYRLLFALTIVLWGKKERFYTSARASPS